MRKYTYLCLILLHVLLSLSSALQAEVANDHSPDLEQKLLAALLAKGTAYTPRTGHLESDGRPIYTNRLILEDSPYLLQHAHNPVDWYAWGEEAFAKARRENRLVFLSIGYSTCHWCHVMEQESFENEEIAAFLNQHFVAIKVDRERRPDLDEIYMTAVMLISGRGGWPMSSFLSPAGRPVYGGTYYPAEQFKQLLLRITTVWQDRPAEMLEQATQITEAIRQHNLASGQLQDVGQQEIRTALAQLAASHDALLGGFAEAPKFPQESSLQLLLQHALRTGQPYSYGLADFTLKAMAAGGIHDQIGGGFHRYSTDSEWLVPHFEKMLYNQANLLRAYLRAWQLSGDPRHERVARQIIDYVLTEMTASGGAFYSAQDADSEGREGAFYVWDMEQLESLLDADELRLVTELYGASRQGNFAAQNILHYTKDPYAYARTQGVTPVELLQRIDRLRSKLNSVRAQRPRPLRDDKIISAWNGMLITALAEAAELLDEPPYADAAIRAAEFLWTNNRNERGELLRVHLHGSSSVLASQEDYAYLAEAFLSLYDTTGNSVWLQRAQSLLDDMLELFLDSEGGGFYMTAAAQAAELIARPKNSYDSAMPSGNSVAVRALLMLAQRSGDRRYLELAKRTLAVFYTRISQQPSAFTYMLMAADEALNGNAGPNAYAANGAVRVRARITDERQLLLDISIRDGWHINADKPLSKGLIPTRLSLTDTDWQLDSVYFPASRMVQLGFQEEPLAVFEKELQISASLNHTASHESLIMSLELQIQACSHEVCLLAETIKLEVPVHRIMSVPVN